jgi:putative ABC transport system permease protein
MPREPRIPGLRRFLRIPDRLIERDIDDEIAFHVESRVRALVSLGHSEEEARGIAAAEFGDLHASRRELARVDRRRRRRERLAHLAETIAQDFRHAIRSLRRSPAFTLTAVVTLVIGIGSAVAIFAVVDGVLLRPLPFANPDRLVGAWHDFPPLGMTHGGQSVTTYFTYRTQATTIEGIGIYKENAVNVAGDGSAVDPERVTSASVSASLLSVLGVSAMRGRVFTEAEDQPDAAPVMLISEGLWHAQLGSDLGVVGRALDVNGVRRTIVGVMPSSFRFPSAETEIWIPLGVDPVNPPADAFAYTAVARLKPGVSVADAQREFQTVLPRVESYPKFVPGITTHQMLEQVRPTAVLTTLRDDITGGIAGTLWMIAAAAGLVLLVACVNVATLSLVRADARQRELAVREALGAARARIVRYYFSESAVLGATAGLVGLVLAWIAVRALASNGPTGVPRLSELGIDSRAVIFLLVITALAAVASSLIPALRIGSGASALRQAVRGGAARQQRIRSVLVAAQMALGLVVLAGSGLLIRSFERLHAVRLGFDPEHVATFWLSLPRTRYRRDEDAVRVFTELVNRSAQLPGVRNVGVTSRLPLVARGVNPNPLYPEDAPEYATKLPPLQIFTTVGGDYFRTMRIPLLAGRLFDRMETQREGEAIISGRTAQLFWRDSTGTSVLGKRFRALPTGPWSTVIGVVGNTLDTALATPASPTVYFPENVEPGAVGRTTARTMALVVRTTGEPATIVPAIQRIVHDVDPALPMFNVQTMSEAVRASTARLAFTILILGGAAVVTLILGAVGLYGVMAYVVTLRRRELGIRVALGASPRGIALATTRHGIALAFTGMVSGLALFGVTSRFLRTFLFGIAPWDPAAVTGAALALLLMATLATWIPARRAGRVDPVEALRSE